MSLAVISQNDSDKHLLSLPKELKVCGRSRVFDQYRIKRSPLLTKMKRKLYRSQGEVMLRKITKLRLSRIKERANYLAMKRLHDEVKVEKVKLD